MANTMTSMRILFVEPDTTCEMATANATAVNAQ